MLKIDWDLWADSDDEEEAGHNFELPPNFQDLMANVNMGGDLDMHHHEDHCGCGCGKEECECDSESDDSDDMPALEEAM